MRRQAEVLLELPGPPGRREVLLWAADLVASLAAPTAGTGAYR